MTNQEIIELVDDARPNAYSDQQKLRWIAELDGKIALELLQQEPAEVEALYQYRYPEDLEREPLLSFPHDGLYEAYLVSQIEYKDGAYDAYQNSRIMFKDKWDDFAAWFLNGYDPAQRGGS